MIAMMGYGMGMGMGHGMMCSCAGIMPLIALIAATALLVWVGERAQNQYARVARIIAVVVIIVSIFMVVSQVTRSFYFMGEGCMRGKAPMPNMMNFGSGEGGGQGHGQGHMQGR